MCRGARVAAARVRGQTRGDHVAGEDDLLQHQPSAPSASQVPVAYRGEAEQGDVVVNIGLGVVRPPHHALHPDGLGREGLAGDTLLLST